LLPHAAHAAGKRPDRWSLGGGGADQTRALPWPGQTTGPSARPQRVPHNSRETDRPPSSPAVEQIREGLEGSGDAGRENSARTSATHLNSHEFSYRHRVAPLELPRSVIRAWPIRQECNGIGEPAAVPAVCAGGAVCKLVR